MGSWGRGVVGSRVRGHSHPHSIRHPHHIPGTLVPPHTQSSFPFVSQPRPRPPAQARGRVRFRVRFRVRVKVRVRPFHQLVSHRRHLTHIVALPDTCVAPLLVRESTQTLLYPLPSSLLTHIVDLPLRDGIFSCNHPCRTLSGKVLMVVVVDGARGCGGCVVGGGARWCAVGGASAPPRPWPDGDVGVEW